MLFVSDSGDKECENLENRITVCKINGTKKEQEANGPNRSPEQQFLEKF